MTDHCPAVRGDGEPCWMLQHPGRLHITANYEQFLGYDEVLVNQAPDPSLDVLRDAPDALRRMA